MLLQSIELEQEFAKDGRLQLDTVLVKTVRANYKGYTKKEGLKAKEARCAQAMIVCVCVCVLVLRFQG